MRKAGVNMSDGLCQCGCGEKPNIAPFSNKNRGWVRGQPLRYVFGHSSRKSPVAYVVDEATGCWVWQLGMNSVGYGLTRDAVRKPVYAHRVYFERFKHPLSPGQEVHHLCRNPACVNPEHLQAVTRLEHARLGKAAQKSHCLRGHTLEDAYIGKYGWRQCRTCHRERERSRRRAALKPQRQKPTHCHRGHPFDATNTYVDKKGWWSCRACHREYQRERYRKLRRAS